VKQAETNTNKLCCGLSDTGAFINNFCIAIGIYAAHITTIIAAFYDITQTQHKIPIILGLHSHNSLHSS